MKLERPQPRGEKVRAGSVLGLETDFESKFDLHQVILEKLAMLQSEILVEEMLAKDKENIDLVFPLSHLRMLEEVLGMDILATHKDRLLRKARAAPVEFQEDNQVSVVSERDPALAQVGWIQLFPDEGQAVIHLSDTVLASAKQELVERRLYGRNIIPFVLMLCVLRPDKRGELAQMVKVNEFEEMWKQRQVEMTTRALGRFLGSYAALLLLHPEERAHFSLTDEEKQVLVRSIRAGEYPNSQAGSILKNAAIVLGEEAEVDERGKIKVVWKKPALEAGIPLPARSHL